jgi:hypothetical protein
VRIGRAGRQRRRGTHRAHGGAQLRTHARRHRPVLQLGNLALDPIEVQVHLPLVIAAEAHAEDHVVHVLRGHGHRRRAVQGRLYPVKEGVNLIDFVSAAHGPPPESLTMTAAHASPSLAAS